MKAGRKEGRHRHAYSTRQCHPYLMSKFIPYVGSCWGFFLFGGVLVVFLLPFHTLPSNIIYLFLNTFWIFSNTLFNHSYQVSEWISITSISCQHPFRKSYLVWQNAPHHFWGFLWVHLGQHFSLEQEWAFDIQSKYSSSEANPS